jgi:hypothetical protein
MRRVMRFAIEDVLPSETDVLRRLEMPRDANVRSALRVVLDDVATAIRACAKPAGVVRQVSPAEFADVYHGEGRNAQTSPLEAIYAQAEALALFAGTIGERVTAEIKHAFDAGDPAFAAVLDAYASETANQLAYAIAVQWSGGHRSTVLPYSPGYCGWHVSGQRALFRALQPDEAGITISESCLMTPLKSVSGVLVAGEPSVHLFRPSYAFCDECATHDCIRRMASVKR